MLNRDKHDLVVAAERMLLESSVRGDPDQLGGLLAEEFREIGASGRLFDRASIMQELESEPPIDLGASLTEVVTASVSDQLVLLTYRLRAGGRTSRRSSLWRVDGGEPLLVFHQGTPAD